MSVALPAPVGPYSDSSYEANGGTSYWGMATGHNCTNYVAFRLIQNGMDSARPPADAGKNNKDLNAYLWGSVYATKTNGTPSVGSIAWWDSKAGMGATGHVAYVERVNTDGSVTVSEDSFGGTYDWKTISSGGGGWPTGFMHLKDKTPVDDLTTGYQSFAGDFNCDKGLFLLEVGAQTS